MANNFFLNRNGIALGSLPAPPSNPLNGDFYYDTTLNKFRRYENGAWGSFGSGVGGSGKNYLTAYTASTASGVPNVGNGDLEGGTTSGFSLGHASLTSNFPSGAPSFGSGASGNLSLSIVSSAQLAGLYSLGYASSAATTAGDFVATDAFFIDIEDQNKVLNFNFSYQAKINPSNGNFSGTSSNSFGVAIYDVTNSTWIKPAGVFNFVQNSGIGSCSGSFQTSSNGTQYRLVVYNANASSGAITMYFDNFTFGPQVVQKGPAVSDWIAFTPTLTGFGTVSNLAAYYRRVGDTLEFQGSWTNNASVSGNGSIGLPSGLSIDTSKIPTNASGSVVGVGSELITVGSPRGLFSNDDAEIVFFDGSTTDSVFIAKQNGSSAYTKITGQASRASNFFFRVPILGWSSNSVMSNDTDTRVVAANYSLSVNQTPGAGNVINFDSKAFDTHGAVTTGASWVFTAPVSGIYDVSFVTTPNGVTTNYVLLKNGSAYALLGTSSNTNEGFCSTTSIQLSAGDRLAVQVSSGTTILGGTGSNNFTYISISKKSGPAIVTATETVSASYRISAATLAVTSATQVNFDSKVHDTHGAVTTGASWKFSAPVTGFYRISTTVATSPAGSGGGDIFIYKNGVAHSALTYLTASVNSQSGSITVQLNAGEYVDIRPASSLTLTGIFSSKAYSHVSIERI